MLGQALLTSCFVIIPADREELWLAFFIQCPFELVKFVPSTSDLQSRGWRRKGVGVPPEGQVP